jgi:glycoprotease/Kae1 family metallohydrolase
MYYLAIESSCDETSLSILELCDDTVAEGLSLHVQKIGDSKSFYQKINQIQVISSIISSQIETHALYGGVVPEVGARLHAEQIHGLFEAVLNEAILKLNTDKNQFYKKLKVIFVTAEPGLMSALRVGIEFAKSLQFYVAKQYNQQVKLEFVNHLQGHVASCFYEMNNFSTPREFNQFEKAEVGNSPLEGWQSQTDGVLKCDTTNNDFKDQTTNNGDTVVAATTNYSNSNLFPHLHLMISGGNTQIRLLNSWNDWEIVGQTIDDAAGECFDKAARMVGIPYPGGATLSKIAGDQYFNPLSLPIAMLQSHDLNISLSGLKTAVRYKIQGANIPNLVLDEPLAAAEIEILRTQSEFTNNPKLQFIKDICISTQFAIIEQVKRKIDLAIQQYQPKSIGISGGVSANQVLVNKIQELKSVQSLETPKIFFPDSSLTGDNAVMIGLAGLTNTKTYN